MLALGCVCGFHLLLREAENHYRQMLHVCVATVQYSTAHSDEAKTAAPSEGFKPMTSLMGNLNVATDRRSNQERSRGRLPEQRNTCISQ